MLENGADPNLKRNRDDIIPLKLAKFNENEDIVQIMLAAGDHPELTDDPSSVGVT